MHGECLRMVDMAELRIVLAEFQGSAVTNRGQWDSPNRHNLGHIAVQDIQAVSTYVILVHAQYYCVLG